LSTQGSAGEETLDDLKKKEEYFKNVSSILNGGIGLQSDTNAEERTMKIND
jgi:hypothetical protein